MSGGNLSNTGIWGSSSSEMLMDEKMQIKRHFHSIEDIHYPSEYYPNQPKDISPIEAVTKE